VYEALDYVRKSERKTGLSRKAKTAATTTKGLRRETVMAQQASLCSNGFIRGFASWREIKSILTHAKAQRRKGQSQAYAVWGRKSPAILFRI
jgi:hypothetical protein